MSGRTYDAVYERSSAPGPAPRLDFLVSAAKYPWLPGDAEIPTAHVELDDGTDFYYGSLIGLNGTVRKIAGTVPVDESESLQEALFAALPNTLEGNPNPRITKAQALNGAGRTLLVVTKRSMHAAGLVFAVEPGRGAGSDLESGSESGERPPVVLRAGISPAKDYPKLMRVLGVKCGRG